MHWPLHREHNFCKVFSNFRETVKASDRWEASSVLLKVIVLVIFSVLLRVSVNYLGCYVTFFVAMLKFFVCSPSAPSSPVAHIHPRKCGWEEFVGSQVLGWSSPPVPASQVLQGKVASSGMTSTSGQTSAFKLTPRIVRTIASSMWTLNISSQKDKNPEVSDL